MRATASLPLTSPLTNPSLLEEMLYDLPALEGVLLHWQTHGAAALTPGIVSLFSRRKYLLGPATLPGTSIQLLATCGEECLPRGAEEAGISPWEARPLHTRLLRHRHSNSAVETQALLPPGVLVQKTVTLALGELLVLCTGVGTWRLSRQDLDEIAMALGLSNRRSRHATINPATFQTVEACGMLPGMVSPFLRPCEQPGSRRSWCFPGPGAGRSKGARWRSRSRCGRAWCCPSAACARCCEAMLSMRIQPCASSICMRRRGTTSHSAMLESVGDDAGCPRCSSAFTGWTREE